MGAIRLNLLLIRQVNKIIGLISHHHRRGLRRQRRADAEQREGNHQREDKERRAALDGDEQDDGDRDRGELERRGEDQHRGGSEEAHAEPLVALDMVLQHGAAGAEPELYAVGGQARLGSAGADIVVMHRHVDVAIRHDPRLLPAPEPVVRDLHENGRRVAAVEGRVAHLDGIALLATTGPLIDIEDRGVSVIAPLKTLRLVGLFTPELRRLGIPSEEMFQAHDSIYPFCRNLAEMAWQDNPDADRIVWSSVRDSAARAMLLFGDRLGPADFSVESVRLVATDPTLLDELNETAARCSSFIAR